MKTTNFHNKNVAFSVAFQRNSEMAYLITFGRARMLEKKRHAQ